MPSQTAFRSITIAISSAYLQQLFGHLDHPIIRSMLSKSDFAYETGLSQPMLGAAESIRSLPVPESLASPFCRSKCEEMICYVLTLLIERERTPASRIHIDDIKALYAVKTHLQSHLDSPPNISGLAREAGMSEPKLRRLFRQVFGTGVFEYYQSMRMQEAARLLRQEGLTVAEVGYRMGFVNLSHFSKVFEQHHGVKPKKYSVR